MVYVLVGMSLMFLVIGFIITENNAKHLLSGYNTMNKEEKSNFDIKSYISGFRNFHIFLAVSFLIIGILLNQFIGENAVGLFLGIYPVIAYIFYIWKSTKNGNAIDSKTASIAIGALVFSLTLVVGLFYMGFKENKLEIFSNKIEISGMYSMSIPFSEIEIIKLVDDLPDIKYKINGYALEDVYKGYFKTKEGERIRLFLNSKTKPYILILTNDDKIYYSLKEGSNEKLFNRIMEQLSLN